MLHSLSQFSVAMTKCIIKCVLELLLCVLTLILVNVYALVDGKESSNMTDLNTTYVGARYDENRDYGNGRCSSKKAYCHSYIRKMMAFYKSVSILITFYVFPYSGISD